jgi:hypothetical protein
LSIPPPQLNKDPSQDKPQLSPPISPDVLHKLAEEFLSVLQSLQKINAFQEVLRQHLLVFQVMLRQHHDTQQRLLNLQMEIQFLSNTLLASGHQQRLKEKMEELTKVRPSFSLLPAF